MTVVKGWLKAWWSIGQRSVYVWSAVGYVVLHVFIIAPYFTEVVKVPNVTKPVGNTFTCMVSFITNETFYFSVIMI